jgi:hypothetical protein
VRGEIDGDRVSSGESAGEKLGDRAAAARLESSTLMGDLAIGSVSPWPWRGEEKANENNQHLLAAHTHLTVVQIRSAPALFATNYTYKKRFRFLESAVFLNAPPA